jgi:hypothetical protein
VVAEAVVEVAIEAVASEVEAEIEEVSVAVEVVPEEVEVELHPKIEVPSSNSKALDKHSDQTNQ